MHSVANFATLQTPLATFFPSKKRPNLVSENHWYCRARSCSPSARAHTSLSLSVQRAHTSLSLSLSVQRAHTLSLCVCSARVRERSNALIQLKTQILCCFSNFTCKYSRNHSTAIVFILCVFDFIRRRCDYHVFFVQINILEGSWLCSLVLMGRVSVTISYSFRV